MIPNIRLGCTNLYYLLSCRYARIAQSEAGKRLKIATVRVQIPLRVPRDIAQLGSATALGAVGRRFKSCYPD